MPNKNYKILIIGFGSIGRRHYKNLTGLGFKKVYIFDIDKKRIANQNLKITSLNLKTLQQFNIVFVCGPSNLHIKHSLLAAKAGCHLFIEKPLSHNLHGVEELQKICRKLKLVSLVACNMRFNPCLLSLKNYLAAGRLGKIYSLGLETGYYLPFWRPEEDYSKSYAAKNSAGGGIILDGGIHNFDLLFWLNNFNPIAEADLIYNKASDLKINTEDNFTSFFKFKNKILGFVKGDYLQKTYSWTLKAVGEKGNLEWDFKKNAVWLYNESGAKKLFKPKQLDINQMYIDEVNYFIKCVAEKRTTFNDIARSARILKIILDNKHGK